MNTVVTTSKIKSITKSTVDKVPVYDIEVPKYNNFILSNSLVVHNSKDLSDSIAGALYNASLHEKALELYVVESLSLISETNDVAGASGDVENLLSNLVLARRADVSNIVSESSIIHDEIDKYVSTPVQESKPSSVTTDEQIRQAIARAKALQRGYTEQPSNSRFQDQQDTNDGFIIV